MTTTENESKDLSYADEPIAYSIVKIMNGESIEITGLIFDYVEAQRLLNISKQVKDTIVFLRVVL